MKNRFTFLTYICCKDQDKLMHFVWNLPYKIEVKEIIYARGKWFLYFNHQDHANFKTSIKNLDLDKL